MHLQELINRLVDLHATHGDVPIVVQDVRSGVIDDLSSVGVHGWSPSDNDFGVTHACGDKVAYFHIG